MPQFPDWKRPVTAVTDAAQLRQSQVRQFASDLAEQGRTTTGEISAKAFGLAERTRNRATLLPRTVVDELRRRINLLDLATRQDVEVQSRLGRNRVSVVVKEFLEAQRRHDAELLESLRTEIREELQSFAAAIDDDLFVPDALPSTENGGPRGGHAELDYDDGDDDDDDDDDIIDLTEDELTMLEATEG
jgi:hypothetical protein